MVGIWRDEKAATIAPLGIDKLTGSAIGMWKYSVYFDVNMHSEWAPASTYRALRRLCGSASPRLQVNLSIPKIVLQNPAVSFPQSGGGLFLNHRSLTIVGALEKLDYGIGNLYSPFR